jgi:uncharacterized protein
LKIDGTPLFHKFATDEGFYVYETSRNDLFRLDEFAYRHLEEVLESIRTGCFGDGDPRKRTLADWIAEHGTFPLMRPRRLIFRSAADVSELIASRLQDLILNVTDQCNLRCRYCIYSGLYPFERRHAPLSMTPETAEKALEYFFRHNHQADSVGIGFYGGEPSLRFPFVRTCLERALEMNPSGRPIHFTLTTNATLLNEEMIRYFAFRKVGLVISLDGPEIIHDRYRRSLRGRGSYARVLNAVARIHAFDAEYFRDGIQFNMVLAPPYDLEAVEDWCREFDGRFGSKPWLLNLMAPFNTDFFKVMAFEPESSREQFLRQEGRLQERFETAARGGTPVSSFAKSLFGPLLKDIHERSTFGGFDENHRLSHLCVPGARKLFVDSRGDFHFCPNVSTGMAIGNVEDGIRVDDVMRYIEEFLDISRDCLDCWALRLCRQSCYQIACRGGSFSLEQKRKACRNIREVLDKNLVMYCRILEKNPRAFSKKADPAPAGIST